MRLNNIERRLDELYHRQLEDEKFLKDRHKNDYAPAPYDRTRRTYDYGTGSGTNVPARKKTDNFGSGANPNDAEGDFPPPVTTGRHPRPRDPVNEDTQKVILPPVDDKAKSDSDKSNDSTEGKEESPAAMRLENRLTSRAIAPRDRHPINSVVKTAIAKSGKKTVKTFESSRTADIVQR